MFAHVDAFPRILGIAVYLPIGASPSVCPVANKILAMLQRYKLWCIETYGSNVGCNTPCGAFSTDRGIVPEEPEDLGPEFSEVCWALV